MASSFFHSRFLQVLFLETTIVLQYETKVPFVYFPFHHNKFKKACTQEFRFNKINPTASPRTSSSSIVFLNRITVVHFGMTAFMLKFQQGLGFYPTWLVYYQCKRQHSGEGKLHVSNIMKVVLTLWPLESILGAWVVGGPLSELPVYLTTHRWSHLATLVCTVYTAIFKVWACTSQA